MAAIPPPPGLVLLPQEIQGAACGLCQTPRARWSWQAEPAGPICARCVFYTTPWGEAHKLALDLLLLAREQARGVPIARDAAGRVLDCAPLDIVLAAVVLPWVMESRRRQCQ